MAEQPTREEAQALYEQMTVPDLQAELGERQMTKTGTKPELVARLLDADFPPAPADEGDGGGAPSEEPGADPAADEEPVAEDGDICGICWPDGWPSKDTNNASCEHGVWDR